MSIFSFSFLHEEPYQEVKVELLGATKDEVEIHPLQGLREKKASGSYHHFEDWVLGRPVNCKTEDHNFTLSLLPDPKAWGFSEQADAKYAFIVARFKNGSTGPNLLKDVDRWDNYPGHDWEEKGLEM